MASSILKMCNSNENEYWVITQTLLVYRREIINPHMWTNSTQVSHLHSQYGINY